MDYTLEDVIAYWDNNKPTVKTRKRQELDKRNYIIALLYYKFELTEESICTIVSIDRTTVNYAKRQTYRFMEMKEYTFLDNTKEVRKTFPYNFPDPDKKINSGYGTYRKYASRIYMDETTYKKLSKYAKKQGVSNIVAIRNLLEKSLETWGE